MSSLFYLAGIIALILAPFTAGISFGAGVIVILIGVVLDVIGL